MLKGKGKKLLSSMLAATLGLGAMATSAASFAAEQNWRFANLCY